MTIRESLAARCTALGLSYNTKTTIAQFNTLIEIEEDRVAKLNPVRYLKTPEAARAELKRRKRASRKAARLAKRAA